LIADQDETPGTGRAVQCALAALEALPQNVAAPAQILVIPGDTPLLDGPTLTQLATQHAQENNVITLLTACLPNPFGYGRVVRNSQGQVEQIVEEKDASEEQRRLQEVNASVYLFQTATLRDCISQVTQQNAQGEVYLTDVVQLARQQGGAVGALTCKDPATIAGINDRAALSRVASTFNRRLVEQFQLQGVTVVDPATTWIDAEVELEADVTVLPGTHLAGNTVIAAGAVIGPFTTLTDTKVGRGATVDRTVATGVVIGPAANVGPFTHLRPGTVLGADTKAGSFTELKAAQVETGAKVPHLAYVGDAAIGEGANVGAGTIFANYDGVHKSRCSIGPAVRIGSNNVIVAPVEMGAGAYSGAGTIVRGDVPPGALVVSAPAQRLVEGWTLRKRPGSSSARAAAQAGSWDNGGGADLEPGQTPTMQD
jgi:bifunctional UDP-N-acetylglucosamine pyrophosphorylase/glucosamine-1-phosphate N-acetyltransferase